VSLLIKNICKEEFTNRILHSMQQASDIDLQNYCEALRAENNQLKEQQNLSQIQIAGLQQQLLQLQKMIFGSRHERFVPGTDTSQLSLDIEAEQTASCSVVDAKKISYTRTNVSIESKPLSHPGRMKLPEHLRREEIIIEPLEYITGLRKMGEEITEVLEWEPGELFVKKYV
jgi:hypothetical protein